MTRLLTALSTCKACGDAAIRSDRYCPPCRDEIREMVDEYDGRRGEEDFSLDSFSAQR